MGGEWVTNGWNGGPTGRFVKAVVNEMSLLDWAREGTATDSYLWARLGAHIRTVFNLPGPAEAVVDLDK